MGFMAELKKLAKPYADDDDDFDDDDEDDEDDLFDRIIDMDFRTLGKDGVIFRDDE